ncbi:hypothetical protein DVH24_010790, partial [Malus domestica]
VLFGNLIEQAAYTLQIAGITVDFQEAKAQAQYLEMSNRKEANFGFQEFAVRFQFIPNKKGSTNSVTEISKTFELSEQRHVRKSKNFIGVMMVAGRAKGK